MAAHVAVEIVGHDRLLVVGHGDVTDRETSPTSGWPLSMPLSTTHTVTPAPVEPPTAHSRVTRSGQT